MARAVPEEFIAKMSGFLGEEETAKLLEALGHPMEHGLRVNTGRMSVADFQSFSPWTVTPIPWCPSGLYLNEDAAADPPSRHPLYFAGAYYLQEPSAMLPAAALPVRPGDRVLDLCAAPGGKSTALAEKLKGEGVLVCNDISASRAKALIKNLELFGVTNAVVTAETPERLAGIFEHYFDKILIDAPCSGEGMFRKSSAMMADWTKDKPEEYAAIQREILSHALRMLRPGGMLLYSTCTYSPEEDEGSVQFLLDLPEAKEIDLRLTDIPVCPGFLPGDPGWISGGSADLCKTVHMLPSRVRGEGHFAALFTSGNREEEPEQSTDRSVYPLASDPKQVAESLRAFEKKYPDFADFCRSTNILWDSLRLSEQSGYLSYVPDVKDLPGLKGIRVMRRGLFLGEIRKNRYEPSQALAMTLSPESFHNCLRLSLEDERVFRYLRGETLEYEPREAKDGWVLITIGDLPLGFGKAKDGRIKNKYLPGWRIGA